MLLLVACGAITLGAIQRLFEPEVVQTGPMMIVAGVGIVINLGTALMFMRGSKDDINIRGAFFTWRRMRRCRRVSSSPH